MFARRERGTVGDRRFSRFETLTAYGRLPHAVPIIAVMATTIAMGLVVAPGAAWRQLLAVGIAMLGAQLVIGVANELVDFEIDRATKVDKPLVQGAVTWRGAVNVLAIGAALMAGGSSVLGKASLLLCVAGCGVGIAYSLWFKRTRLAWIPYFLALPLLPIWVAVSLDAYANELLWLYPLGALAVIGVQFAQSVTDIDADRAAGIASITTKLGERRTLAASWTATVASGVLVGGLGWSSRWSMVAGTAAIVAVLVDALLYVVLRVAAVRAAFPIAAVSTGMLGVAWVYAGRT
jgi:4-hydroxybenzoate polyprenyltransferase